MTALFKLLQPELEEVRQRLHKEITFRKRFTPDFNWPALSELDQKFLPTLVLISANAKVFLSKKALSLATIFQFIFLASFIHCKAEKNIALETLMGDYFYTRFFDLLCRDDNIEFLEPLSKMICQIHLQANKQNCELDIKKTGSDNSFSKVFLAKEAAYLGSKLGHVSLKESKVWQEVGILLGKLWDKQPVTTQAMHAIEKLTSGQAKKVLGEFVLYLSSQISDKKVIAL
ncbi:MAG: hypothetical protein PWP31_1182 [Clostridia bacterium]|nr:hypothetical protein [Clostridia bacterium]